MGMGQSWGFVIAILNGEMPQSGRFLERLRKDGIAAGRWWHPENGIRGEKLCRVLAPAYDCTAFIGAIHGGIKLDYSARAMKQVAGECPGCRSRQPSSTRIKADLSQMAPE